ncbi:Ferrochelatase [bacterium HR39]|nr:Ferrochelatase [bacterium HR39]
MSATRHRPADHPPVPEARIGVLLANLGTPSGTGYRPMRRYLSEFLSDPRVIDYSPWFWQPLLQLVILAKRPFTSGAAYRRIWNYERDESPLMTVTREQTEKLRARLRRHDPEILVEFAMRYGEPAIPDVLRRMVEAGCRRLLFVPLYPQYAAPTTASACDRLFEATRELKWVPAIRVVPPWYDDPGYIEVLARSIREHLAGLDFEPDLLIFSYHGEPKRFLHEGDPYHCHCAKTTRLVRERLGLPEERTLMCFQSRFGSEEWLQPYLDETLKELPARGIRRVAVVSPAFVADCLETLEELAIANRELFLEAGGEHYAYIPCLNAREDHMAFLEGLVLRELAGWLEPARAAEPSPAAAEATR